MTRSALREFFHRQTAAEWLATRCGMSLPDAVLRLEQVQVSPHVPISTLAGNPRWLIGFLAATFHQPSVVVFTTTGCDPLGTQRALRTASERLNDAAGVYLTCLPHLGVSEPDYAAVLNIATVELEPAA